MVRMLLRYVLQREHPAGRGTRWVDMSAYPDTGPAKEALAYHRRVDRSGASFRLIERHTKIIELPFEEDHDET